MSALAQAALTASTARAPVLLLEGDEVTAAFLGDQLAADGFSVMVAHTAEHALALARQHEPSLLLLGDLAGRRETLDLLASIRRRAALQSSLDPALPTLVLSRHAAELDILRCFEAGADDVVKRPFSYPELRARIHALLRRAHGLPRRRTLRVGALEIDTDAHVATVSGSPVELCKREYDLLVHLAGDPERVFTKHELLRDVWGFRANGATRTLDSHACRLRRKLGGQDFVINVWGVGYCLARAHPVAGGFAV